MTRLVVYPAIDLLAGRVVRLQQGDRSRVTVYAEDPAEVARAFKTGGAEWIHVVDLDAAFDGPAARQVDGIDRIVAAADGVPVQLGGGLRDAKTIAAALARGVSRVIIGTAALEDRALVMALLQAHGAGRVAVAVDEADGLVRVRGWVKGGGPPAAEFARDLAAAGVRWFLHSAIRRDGTLSGPDLPALERIAAAVGPFEGRVICAGGIGSLADLRALRVRALPAVAGAVAGRALYEKAFTLAAAREALL